MGRGHSRQADVRRVLGRGKDTTSKQPSEGCWAEADQGKKVLMVDCNAVDGADCHAVDGGSVGLVAVQLGAEVIAGKRT